MKRLPNRIYKLIRDRMASLDREYDRDSELLPYTVKLLENEGIFDLKALIRDAADGILDAIEKSDDHAADGLFPDDAHVALGAKRRIRRDCMTLEHARVRLKIVDKNLMSQTTAANNEKQLLWSQIELLEAKPAGTRLKDLPGEPPADEEQA